MVSSLLTLFLPSLWLISIKLLTFSLTIQSKLLGDIQARGWLLMSYLQSLLNLLGKSPPLLSSHMAFSTCFASGGSGELVLCSLGRICWLLPLGNFNYRIVMFTRFVFVLFVCLNRLEKDRKFNYFWVRCAKLICVSVPEKFV